jgi:ERCC4-related helicase
MSTSLTLRPYQRRIVDSIGTMNAIIKMPTGSGKTFIAAELVKCTTTQGRTIFLVPTIALVEQQALALEEWCGPGCRVARYSGGMATPRGFDALVSTPQAFYMLQDRDPTFRWNTFRLCVFDEVHHVLKDHPYRKLAMRLRRENSPNLRIVGLSASLTYVVGEHEIQSVLNRLCHELSITKLESPSREELIAGGYVPQHGNTEIVDNSELPEGVLVANERKPHEMYKLFRKRIANRSATEFALLLWDGVHAFEQEAASFNIGFESPLTNQKLSSWEDYANRLQVKHESRSMDLMVFFAQMEYWYVALRLIVQTWEEEEQLTLQWLLKSGGLVAQPRRSPRLRSVIGAMADRAENSMNFMKLGCLRQQLIDKNARFGGSFRCIIFAQQRISAYILSSYINGDSHLQSLGLKSGYVVARGTSITPSIKVASSSVNETIASFRSGDLKIMVATSVIEEVSA